MIISISQDDPLDKVIVSAFSDLLKKKYGNNVTVTWSQKPSNATVRARSKDKKSDTNITIVIVK